MNIIKDLQNNLPIDVKEIISNDEYAQLDEGAQRAYRRVGNNITQYYRCTSGPKKGKLSASPQACGKRKDPKKVRHGRKVARMKGAVRIRKTLTRKRTQTSKRVTKLNKVLAKRRGGATQATSPVKLAASFKHYLSGHILNEMNNIPHDITTDVVPTSLQL